MNKNGNPGNLRPPWRPGQSGNPAGRKRCPVTEYLTYLMDEVEAAGRRFPEDRKLFEIIGIKLVDIIINGDHRDALRAIEIILDRVEGKATEEPTPTDGGPMALALQTLMQEVVESRLNAQSKRRKGADDA
jgi:hypothetical protein